MIRSWSEKPTARRAEVGKAVLGLAYSRLPNQTPAFSPHFNPQCCICLETSSKSYAEILGLDHMLRSSVQIVCWDPQLRSYAENLCLDRMLRSSFLNQMLRPESISIWSELTISRANLFQFHILKIQTQFWSEKMAKSSLYCNIRRNILVNSCCNDGKINQSLTRANYQRAPHHRRPQTTTIKSINNETWTRTQMSGH